MKPIVIDIDIGTDCDDVFALAYAIRYARENDCRIDAITTVYGDAKMRARIARKLERLLDVDIPIIAGFDKPFEGNGDYWTGREHLALTNEEKVEKIEDLGFPEYKEGTRLVAIGPLTNIAHQIRENPSIKNVNKIYVMGSSADSHNFKVDREATMTVFIKQGWERYQITKETSLKIAFTRQELERFRGTMLGDFMYGSAIRWLDYTKKDVAPMYDVLAVSAALGENYVKFGNDVGRTISVDVDPILKKRILEVVR